MKVLITGCNGQVGHCLVQQLSGKAQVLALDVSGLDITDKDQVMTKVVEFEPDFIINAAAHTAVDKAESEEALSNAINCDGPRYLAEAAHSVGAVILHISTDYVFEGNKKGQYNEDDVTNPQGVYGATKLSGELAVAQACARHIIIRTAWVFGEHGNNFVKTMLRLGKDRDELSIVSDQFGGPTFAGDIAAALIVIAKEIQAGNEEWGVYHFSGAPHVSWFEFSEVIFAQAYNQGVIDHKLKLNAISTEQYPTAAKRPENSKLDCRKIKDTFGIEPSNWQLAIKRIKEYQ
ncbi:dTDP-4-dehydrorhamnose reductase [Vibrio rumoiensis]|uniref:dTDP-4-dehydrorhamnose reductase n=1 Tax=Vibrio rumoiensis 1S-45 TaxID=1188252 RepID=A0A1E5DZ84_9VIBR|nr:dTDP-4-dehydrorhamnose reductase [Vibrio rumoiensis]OEF22689.1 dTDP-4-dehydrorhamnose reductase [Vibrio rumoiensis 1S-45]